MTSSSAGTVSETASFRNAYEAGACTLSLTSVPSNGTVGGQIKLQTQPSSLTGYLTVAATHVFCDAFADGVPIASFDVAGGSTITPQAQSYTWPAVSDYKICGYEVVSLIGGATSQTQYVCSS